MKKIFMALMILAFGCCNVSYAEEYLNVSIAKMKSPAFTEDLSNKKIVITPTFIMIHQVMLDLPPEYRDDYIRISAGAGADMFMNILVPKYISDQAYDVASEDVVSQRSSNIKIYGQTRQMIQRRIFGGGQQGALLFIVDKIEISTPEVSSTKKESMSITLDIPNTLVEKLLVTASKKGSNSLEEVILTILKEKYE